MLINANIKSREELKTQLDNGEGFEMNGVKLWFDESRIYFGESPYRLGNFSVYKSWDKFAEMKIKKEPIVQYGIIYKCNKVSSLIYGDRRDAENACAEGETVIKLVQVDDD